MKKNLQLIYKNHIFKAFGLIFIGSFLRFFLLTNQSLWWDEGYSLNNSEGSSPLENLILVRHIFNADKFQPLYYWILFWVRKTLGDSEAVLRGFSALLGALTLPVIYFTALNSYSKKHALWSLGIATFSAFLIYYSQEVRNYSLMILIASLQLYFLSLILFNHDKRISNFKVVVAFAFLSCIGLFCSIQMLVFTCSLCLSHFFVCRDKKIWVKHWLVTILASWPAIVYFASLPGKINPSSVPISRTGGSMILNIAYTVYGLLVGITYGPPQDELRSINRVATLSGHFSELFIFFIFFCLILSFLVVVLVRRNSIKVHKTANYHYFLLIVFCLFFGSLLAKTTGMNWVPRHSSFMVLPILLLLPSTFCDHLPNPINTPPPETYRFAKFTILALIVMNIYSSGNYFFDDRHWRDDYRGLTQHLISLQENSYTSILLTGEPSLLKYYGDFQTTYKGGYTRKLKEGNPSWVDDIASQSSDHDRFVVTAYQIEKFTQDNIANALSSEFRLLNINHEFKGFQVYQLERNSN